MKTSQTPLNELQPQNTSKINQFLDDVLLGLQSNPKQLYSKYFYDAIGDRLFQDLMNCKEYYPTNCELEIFSQKTAEICKVIIADGSPFDLLELGAGDATKSTYLLQYLLDNGANFTYMPIDISENVISYLQLTLPTLLPGLKIDGLNGEYFEMLQQSATNSTNRKVVLFLGSNIGNMDVQEAEEFCKALRNQLSPGDLLLVGFDLKKNPATILAAYNDKEGITKKFNLNLLERINRELGGNFNLDNFEHYPTYDPGSGACKSYLVSLCNQVVIINNQHIHFLKDECIYMEISQKFSVDEINKMAINCNFIPSKQFFDSKKWFIDVIWIAA